ncbi:hypothetical protein [Microvirga subterranea]|uniref:Beta-barrel assembly complex subunit BamF n=1 Tax=Microvirga subterranea TaxID=186651 RepID=A0A370HMS1_9HYPH|nr:hypothetical protein [Microvirga subterranea]RDI59799.1 hypothetical protein DES45_10354 [Microvirga subterranea]
MSPVLKLKMRFTTKALPVSRVAAAGLTVLLVANAAGCAEGSNPTRDLFAAVGAGPKVAQTPDFVASSRPEKLDFLPVGTSEPGRSTPARTADEVKAAEAELDALRAQNEAAGKAAAQLGGTPAPQPVPLPKTR